MTTQETSRTDTKGSIEGIMWYCGDDVCDCSQPKIVTRNERGYLVTEECDEDLFFCDADLEEIKRQSIWLLKRSRELKVDNLAEVEAEYGHYEACLTNWDEGRNCPVKSMIEIIETLKK